MAVWFFKVITGTFETHLFKLYHRLTVFEQTKGFLEVQGRYQITFSDISNGFRADGC